MKWKNIVVVFFLLFSQICFVTGFTQNGTSATNIDTESLSLDSVGEENYFELIGQWDQNYGYGYDIVIQNDLAFIAGEGLIILNVSNPTTPVFVSQFKDDETYHTNGVFVKEDLAFIIGYRKGLRILNISEITNPNLVSSYDTYARDVFVQGNFAYILGSLNDFEIIDISNMKKPIKVGSIPHIQSSTNRVLVDGSIAYITSYNGLDIIDIANPAAPTILFEYDLFNAKDLVIHNQTAYIATGSSSGSLIILDVTNTSNPQSISQLFLNCTTYDICYRNDVVYLTNDNNGLTIINVSDITQPKIIPHSLNFDIVYHIVKNNDILYLLTGSNEVFSVNIMNPNYPQQLGVFNLGGVSEDIVIEGNFAYIANGANGLVILDITDKNKPKFISRITTGNYSDRVDLVGDFAYVTTQYFYYDRLYDKIVIYDISNKSNPHYVNEFRNDKYIVDYKFAGNFLYIVSYYHFEIYDISNPVAPILMSYYNDFTDLWSLEIIDDIVFLCTSRGLIILELITPYNVSEVNHCFINTTIFKIAIESNIGVVQATIGDGGYQIKTVDLSDLMNPIEKSDTSNEYFYSRYGFFDSYVLKMMIKNGKVYTVTSEGLVIIKISFNGQLKEIGHYTNQEITEFVILDDVIYLSAKYDGVLILDRNIGGFDVRIFYIIIPVLAISIVIIVIIRKKTII